MLRMRRASRLLVGMAGALVASGAVAQVPAPEMNPEETEAIHTAATRGLALYSAYQENPAQNTPPITAARELVKDFCPEFQYRAVTLQDADGAVVYFIGAAKKADSVVFGRHYRVSGAAVSASSKSCLAVPAQNQRNGKLAATFTTHLLTDTPTEFHVFESYLHHAPLFVGTRIGIWNVQQGEIRLLKRQADAQAPPDRPVGLTSTQHSQQDAELAPLIERARETYPAARQRFVDGLPRGERLAVVTRLTEPSGKFEQVFVGVESIQDGMIKGVIVSKIDLVSGYKYGDRYSLPGI